MSKDAEDAELTFLTLQWNCRINR